MKRLGILGIAAAAVLASCGGTTTGGGGGGGGSESATFTGSVTGSDPIVVAAAGYASGSNTGVSINIGISGGSTNPTASFVMVLPASTTSLSNGTYTSNNVFGIDAAVTSGGNTFQYIVGSGNSTAGGSLTIDITGTGTQVSAGTGTEWSGIHGTLQATLPQSSGGSGSVTVNATF